MPEAQNTFHLVSSREDGIMLPVRGPGARSDSISDRRVAPPMPGPESEHSDSRTTLPFKSKDLNVCPASPWSPPCQNHASSTAVRQNAKTESLVAISTKNRTNLLQLSCQAHPTHRQALLRKLWVMEVFSLRTLITGPRPRSTFKNKMVTGLGYLSCATIVRMTSNESKWWCSFTKYLLMV